MAAGIAVVLFLIVWRICKKKAECKKKGLASREQVRYAYT
tara:strand:+ start:676 stop:795 length:120 start_codon:yes stop_codon:yes gene_type:complete